MREEDVETDVELSGNEFVIVSPGSTLLSFPVSVGSLSINGRTTEDRGNLWWQASCCLS